MFRLSCIHDGDRSKIVKIHSPVFTMIFSMGAGYGNLSTGASPFVHVMHTREGCSLGLYELP